MIKVPVFHALGGVCLYLVLGFACAISSTLKGAGEGLPNIVLLAVDDMLYNTPESFGGSVEGLTPHIDALAERGMRFTEAYNASSRCAPSRGSMMTGFYQDGYAVEQVSSDTTVKDSIYTIPELLDQKGYLSGLFGKDTHYRPLKKYDFDIVEPMAAMGVGRSPELYAKSVGAFTAEAQEKKRPFFISVNTHDPHRPFAGSPGEREALIKRFESEVKDFETKPELVIPPAELRYNGKGNDAPKFVPDHEWVREEFGYYLNSSKRADDFVGAIVETLEKVNAIENTLIVFLSDNGIHWPFSKANVYVSSVKTPLIVYWEGKTSAGSSSDALISTIDLVPTILDATSIDFPYDLPGKSFLPLVSGQSEKRARQSVFATLNKKGSTGLEMRSVITKKYTYVFNFWVDGKYRYFDGARWGGMAFEGMEAAARTDAAAKKRLEFFHDRPREELYDNRKDADALVNLRNHPERLRDLQRLRQLMRETLAENDDPFQEEYEAYFEAN